MNQQVEKAAFGSQTLAKGPLPSLALHSGTHEAVLFGACCAVRFGAE